MAVDTAPDPTLDELRTTAEELADNWAPRASEIRAHLLDHSEIHPGFWKDFCDAGFAGLLIAPEHGGSGRGLAAMATVLETLTSRNLALTILAVTHASAFALAQLGSEELKCRYLPRIASGEMVFALSFTEAEAGHNFRRMKTVVRCDGEQVVVRGTKSYTSGADFADRLLVVGRSLPADDPAGSDFAGFAGFNAVLVDPHLAGVSLELVPMGDRPVRQWRVDYDDVVVPAGEMLGEEHWGMAALIGMVNVERVLFCAMSLGVARYALTRSVARAGERVVFGKRPIGAHQSIGHPLAALHARLEAARLLLYRGAEAFDVDADPGVVGADVAMAKYLAAEVSYDAADQTIQVFGSAGYDTREGLLDLLIDVRAFRIQPISQELTLDFIAEHVLHLPRSR